MKIRNETKDIKVFAGGIGVLALFFAGISIWKGGNAYPYILGIGIPFAIIGLISQKLIRPIYLKWMIVAGVFGKFQTRLLLSLIFILVISPIGILVRLLGKDILDEKIDPETKSYWIDKEPDRDIARYKKQF